MVAPLQPAYEVVLRLPRGNHSGRSQVPWALAGSPDGALFLATRRGLFRALPGEPRQWTELTAEPVEAHGLYAPSKDAVFAVGYSLGGSVYRWRVVDGWQRMRTPLTDSVIVENDYIHGVPLAGIWGRDERDVYAVGEEAAILHFDGVAWTAEANPLLALVDSGGPITVRGSGARLMAVGGSADGVYAVASDLVRRSGGRWERFARPTDDVARYCGFEAMSVRGRDVLVAGGELPCLFRFRDGRWTDLTSRLGGFAAPGVQGGATQADGSALFWASAYGRGDVAVVRGGAVRVLQFPTIKWFGGAAVVGPYLYVTGIVGDTTIVARTPLPL